MIKSSLIVNHGVLCILLTLLTPNLHADQPEPPLKCEVNRGAWCILRGIGEIKFSAGREEEQWREWSLYDNYWKKQVGVIFEEATCMDTVADDVEVTQVRSNVLWNKRRWNEAIVSLRREGTCKLRLLVPVSDPTFVRKAASSLSGSIAACIPGHACSDNVLSNIVYKSLTTSK